jgi:hypothetical protein
LWHITDLPPKIGETARTEAVYLLAKDCDSPANMALHAQQAPQEGALAGPVGPKQANEFALHDTKRANG